MFDVLPQHLAIIMDGNGRWAQRQGLARTEGHKAGAGAVRTIITECRRLGIPYVTLYTFSRENWNRPKDEVSTLFNLLVEFLGKEVPLMVREHIALNILGDIDGLPLTARTALYHAIQRTSAEHNPPIAMTLNLALNYGGRDEILQATRQAIRSGVSAEALDEATFRQYLYTKGQPDPDLVVRTSGELRISNYLLFQCAYSEFYFTNTLWPDFGTEELHLALADFAKRTRRFGKTQEQVS